jgi:acyl carrier protein
VQELTEKSTLEEVTQILVTSFELDPGIVLPTSHLIDDLDLDSIDAIDIAVELEQKVGINVSEEELRSIRLVQDIVDLIDRHLRVRSQ